MDLRTFMFERRISGRDLVRAATARGFHLTSPDISNFISGRKYYFPPSHRVRIGLRSALKKLGVSDAEIANIEGLTAE